MCASRTELAIIGIGMVLAVASGVAAYRLDGPYGEKNAQDPRVRRIADASGRLRLLIYDANGDGVFDTWSHMDGDRVLDIQIDEDGDGSPDRIEYFNPKQP
jgi:hypothetical protein